MARAGRNQPRKLCILFTCIGRRVSLLRSFRNAASDLNLELRILGADATKLSPALQICDDGFIVHRVTHPEYIQQILHLVEKHHVNLLIPTVDLDLGVIAANRSRFEKNRCKALVSSPEVVDICQDKIRTYNFLRDAGIDTPATYTADKALSMPDLKYPCFLKPQDGYASRGNAVVKNREELKFFSDQVPNCIVQRRLDGAEYTCDVYVDFQMRIRCVVPRKRIEVRAGEVSKAQIRKNPDIMKKAEQTVQKLQAGPGVITVQLFVTEDDKIKIIEINPRFGGGVPLSIRAGADFPRWLLQEILHGKPDAAFDKYRDGLVMLRYDGEVWLQDGKARRIDNGNNR